MDFKVYISKLKEPRFSIMAMVAFAIVFASVGTYVVLKSLAATNFITTTNTTTTLAVPKISYPPDGSILFAKRPQLTWAAVTGANSYRVKIYQDDNLVIDDLAKTNSYTPIFDLPDKGNYYWSVQALNATVALNTPTYELAARRIKTTNTAPSAPALVSPASGTHYTGTSVAVDWSDVTSASAPVTYVAQYAGSATFNADGSYVTPWYTTGTLTGSGVTFLQLQPNTYYWHVKAVDSQGRSSSWSATRTYVVDAPTVVTPPPPTTTDTNVTISNQSKTDFLYNFAIDYARTSNFLMPDPNTKWLGAFVPDTAGDALASFKAYETMVGKPNQVAQKFPSFYWDANFPSATATNFYNSGHYYMATWEPWNPSAGASQAEYTNNAITNNQIFTPGNKIPINFDDYVDRWAKQIKAYKKPVYLRFAHEMNGNWYPWGTVSGNTSASYVAMWKHVHDIFEENGVKNVRWVWCVNNDQTSGFNPSAYYPGDSYVDVMAIDSYNWGTSQSWSSWSNFNTTIANTYNKLAALSSKNIWIAETSSVETGGDKAAWITNAFSSLKTTFPRITNFMWFHSTTWAVNTSTNALNAYKTAVTNY